MKRARNIATGVLVLIFAVSLFAGFVAPAPYARAVSRLRERISISPFLAGDR